jgi:hypothetical protein
MAKTKPARRIKKVAKINQSPLILTLGISLIMLGLIASIMGFYTLYYAYKDTRLAMEYQFSVNYFYHNPSMAFTEDDKSERELEIASLSTRGNYSQVVGTMSLGFSGIVFGIAGILISVSTSYNRSK